MDRYQVRSLGEHPHISVTVPGSKSITNRALLMAAMSEGETLLKGVLFCDDSRVFLQALQEMGIAVVADESEKTVVIRGKGDGLELQGKKIYVGSAGTAARFLTAFVAMSQGTCRLDSSEQMKKRPMKELLDVLRDLGAKIHCLEQEDTFPMEITGVGVQRKIKGEKPGEIPERQATVSLNIDRSSQFLSALLMTAPLCYDSLDITLTGSRSARSYVEMTEQMMKQFGHPGVERLEENRYRVPGGAYQAGTYQVEPDVSAACYFYGMAAVTGGETCVSHMKRDSLQGDMKFLKVLEQMGCILEWRDGQLYLQGPEPGELKGIDVDLSDFSDQALTLAAIAPYANSPVHVRNVAHIRGQECDRIHAVKVNMDRMGIRCEEEEDGFWIYPSVPQPASIDTFQDHRVAMAFALTGIGGEGIVIENPACCSKTFEDYFQILDCLTGEI